MEESARLDVTREIKVTPRNKSQKLQEVAENKQIYKSLHKAVKIISLETDVLKVLEKELKQLKLLLDKFGEVSGSRATTRDTELGEAVLMQRIEQVTKTLLIERDLEQKFAVDLDKILSVIETKLKHALTLTSLIDNEKKFIEDALNEIDNYKIRIKEKLNLIFKQIKETRTKQGVIELHNTIFIFYNQELLPLRVLVLEVEKKIVKMSTSSENDLRKYLFYYLDSLEKDLLVISNSTIQGYTELIFEMRQKILYLKNSLERKTTIKKMFISEIEKHIFIYLDKIIAKLETEQESWVVNEIMASVIKPFISIIITAKDLRLSITRTLYWNKNKESKILLRLLKLIFVLNKNQRINIIWFNFTINHLSELGRFYPHLRKETKIIIYRTKKENEFLF
jgi:hypothetical protein